LLLELNMGEMKKEGLSLLQEAVELKKIFSSIAEK
jgi:hypothetical protein